MVYGTIAFTLSSFIRMRQDVSAAAELTPSTDLASQMKYSLWIHLTPTENAWKGKAKGFVFVAFYVILFCDNAIQFG